MIPTRHRYSSTVRIQSALGTAVFIVSAFLHHAMLPADMRQLALSQPNSHVVRDKDEVNAAIPAAPGCKVAV